MATAPPLATLGKYQLIRKLASGGMAEVFLALTSGPMGFEKQLVVKRILPHLADEQNFISMFLSEARLAAQLNHPNVVQVFDFGEADGAYFLVMEFIDGVNLRVLFRKAAEQHQPLSFTLVARIVSLACEGLAFAHDFVDPATGQPMGLVHRDVSPDNVLIARNGAVKVVDFGIAKAANQTHLTKTGTVKGKFSYMPPEQLGGQELDRRADVFALGIVLYELLTGRKPFDTSNEAFIVRAIMYEPMAPAAQFRPDVPPALQRVLDRALAKSRDERYPDCRAMQSDLERFILSEGEPVSQYQLSQLVQQLVPAAPFAAMPTPSGVLPPPAPTAVLATPLPQPSIVTTPAKPMAVPVAHNAETVRDLGAISLRDEAFEAPAPVAVAPQPRRQSGLKRIAAAGALVIAAGVAWAVLHQSPPVATLPPAPEPVVVAPVPEPEPEPAPEPAPEPVVVAPEPTPEPTPAVDPIAVKPKVEPRPEQRRLVVKPVKATEKPAATAASAQLEFRVRPFGSVWVDGTFVGDTPFPAVRVSVGTHAVRVVNKDLGKEVTKSLEVKEGSNVFRYAFDE